MQTTLLGLAITIILALLAALVGPLLVDWGGYRSVFEAEATRLIGLDVRVTGAIDARLLPSPRLTLHDIEIGHAGQNSVRARSLGIEFALTPLMRGEWRATEMHLTGPQLKLGLDAAGHLQAPNLAIGFDPDALSIDRLSIEDGKLMLADAASGNSVTLNHLWFNGDARSLLGPVKGEGAANVGGDLYPFRLSASRYGEDGKLGLRLNVDLVNYPLSAEADGMISVVDGAPSFDGTFGLRRPVGITGATSVLSQSWQLRGKVKATAASALMQKVEFHYGSRDKGFKLTGVADFKFGKQPRFDSVLSGDRIDLDRALAENSGPSPPAIAIRKLAKFAGGGFHPGIPIKVGIAIDQATLGNDTVQNLRGDISTDAAGWNLDRFEFRAPGFTQARVSGHLTVADGRINFTGPAELKTNDPKALTAWLEGRPAAQNDLRPLSLRGDLTLASDKVAIDRLSAEFDRKPITGNITYVFAAGDRRARLDVALKAADLDIDAGLGFGKALLAGSHIERPRDMTIAADIGHAMIAGLDARNVSAQVELDAGRLRIDRLEVADFGGAVFSARGRIATSPSPQGSVTVDLDARDMTPVTALLARFAPKIAEAVERGAPAMTPAKLHALLSVGGTVPKSLAKLNVDGSLGEVHLAFDGAANADLTALGAGDLQLAGKLSADDGRRLLAVLGLDRFVAADVGAGTLNFDAAGRLRGDLRVNVALTAGGLDANVTGTASPFAEKLKADLRLAVPRANLAPLRAGQRTLPVALSTRVALAGQDLALNDIEAKVAGSALRGKLALILSSPVRLEGQIDADRLNGMSLITAATGAPASKDARSIWSDEPFAGGLFGNYAGRITLKAGSVDFLPRLTAREFGATFSLAKQSLALDDITGNIAGGHLAGSLSFRAGEDGLHGRSEFSLSGSDAGALFATGARPPVRGALALSGKIEGAGLSPAAFIGSLQGSGEFTLSGVQIAGLNAGAFDAVTRAVDQGLPIDQARISDLVSKTLQSGELSIGRARGEFAVSAGQLRLNKFEAGGGAANLSVAGDLDLTSGAVDGRLILSGASEQGGSRPDIFVALKGPLTTPERTIDVSALTGWLTVRAVENQTEQLRAIEHPHPSIPYPRPKSEILPASKVPPAPARSAKPAAPKSQARTAPLHLVPKRAPALPPPVEVGTLPVPRHGARPEASAIGSQR